MCCFSKPVPYVAGTKIFARAYADGRQALVYSMDFAADEELAMILPIPVPPESPEDAVRFVALDDYDRFFDDVRKAFPVMMLEAARSAGFGASPAPQATLKVHDVGDFEASFVPTQGDFDRLDERFKLDPSVWAKLPQYADWGFAVFKLRPKVGAKKGFFSRFLGSKRKTQTVHPMAFTFPRRDPEELFFPTVHVHDGEVHPEAVFDHTLYAQLDARDYAMNGWERSEKALGEVVDGERAKALVDPRDHCWRWTLRSFAENRDITLAPRRTEPDPGAAFLDRLAALRESDE